MEGQDQEKFVIVSVIGPAKAVSELIKKLASEEEPQDLDISGMSDRVAKVIWFRYVDESGRVVYRVRRREWDDHTKDFASVTIGPDGEVVGFGCGDRKVPYNLPELLDAAKIGGTVAVCNGERAAEAYKERRCGKEVVATTFYGGLYSANAYYAGFFKGVGKVIIVEDDGPYARRLKACIQPFVEALENMRIKIEYTSESALGIE